MVEPIFEVHTAGGQAYRIWIDGHIEGFGEDTIVVNRILPVIHREQAKAIQAVHRQGTLMKFLGWCLYWTHWAWHGLYRLGPPECLVVHIEAIDALLMDGIKHCAPRIAHTDKELGLWASWENPYG